MKPSFETQTKPLVSVIILTYNQADTVGQAIDSVLAQQCTFPFEIVLIDDASTDLTSTLCQQYAEAFPQIIRYVRKEENKGVVNNYFDAVDTCRGEYIADCAGDDRWTDPEKLAKQVSILEKQPEVTLVHTAWTACNALTGKRKIMVPWGREACQKQGTELLDTAEMCGMYMGVHLSTALYRKAVLQEAMHHDPQLFRSPIFPCEDVQVVFALARKGIVAYLPCSTLAYTVGNTSISTPATAEKYYLFLAGTLHLAVYLCQAYGVGTNKGSAFYRSRLRAVCRQAFRSHSEALAQRVFSLVQTLPFGVPFRSRCVLFLMRYRLLWNFFYGLRLIVVGIKKLFS